MNRVLSVTGVVAALLLGTPLVGTNLAQAAVTEDNFQLRTTADLVALCTADPAEPMGTAALNFCQGFGVGTYRVLLDVQIAKKRADFCMPVPGPTRNDTIAAFSAWANGNPARLASPAEDSVYSFLMAQYPCPKS